MDYSQWWRLPGPSRFVGSVADDLRDGNNIVLCLPHFVDQGLAQSIRDNLSDCWAWTTVSLDGNLARDPVSVLYDQFGSSDEPVAIRNSRSLAASAGISGRLIWIEGMCVSAWPRWKNFLEEYQHACRSRSLLERGIFCVPLVGELACSPPAEDACLRNHSWRGIIGYFDMIAYTAAVIPRRGLSYIQHRLVVAIVSSLAQWDPLLCDYLRTEPLERLLDPLPLLKEFARERAWDGARPSRNNLESWYLGFVDEMEGRPVIHSAAIAHNDRDSEIVRRIWGAELGVLLPLIEEKRRAFLERFGHCLTVPFQTPFGVVTDVRDLEIGQIDFQISSDRLFVHGPVRRLISCLRDIRNALSHLEPVSPALLSDCGIILKNL